MQQQRSRSFKADLVYRMIDNCFCMKKALIKRQFSYFVKTHKNKHASVNGP